MMQNIDADSLGGMNFGGTGNNPLLWLITLGFLRGNDGFFGNNNNQGAAGVLAGETQAKLDCLQQGHNALSAQLSEQTTGNRFIALNTQINEIQGIQRASTSELAAIQRDATASIVATMNDLRAEQAKCCCETQLGIERVRNDIAAQTGALVAAGLANTQAILDKMCANQITSLTAENNRLQSELSKAEILQAITKKA
ncbi:MAG: hypothetical protein [Podoviridae sp. ctLUJ1]|nr:MAG: hypothetical protein [Podoviridae sp. ctLUJ1]